ncbi:MULTISPECIES: ThuA domain-containing protein [unclassified Streptomyces]|uniref:ThuA domain-containing protein n=1 Tax=unclassified Streptomyces TaxID=2593676 RepID=UPI0037FB04F7
MKRIVVLSGVTGADDPWHDFTATSRAIASCLDDAGWTCTVATTDRSDRAGLPDADLLIVNSGLDSPPGPPTGPPTALLDYLASGRPLLGVHTAANTFGSVPAWTERLGVRWVTGLSMHPPIGPQRLTPAAGPVLAGLGEITVHDELYSHLELLREADVLLAHSLDGRDHPLVLARQDGSRRTVYDALGHGVESYASATRRELLRREVRWLLAET